MRVFPSILAVALAQAVWAGGDFFADADKYLEGLVREGRFSGTVLVVRRGEVMLKKGYGLANREHGVPNRAETKFRLGSITKQFTAMCVLRLQEQGKLRVSDPVSRYMEDAPEAWKEVTLRHLLMHSSGIPGFTEFPDNLQFERLPTTVEATVRRFRDKPLQFRPGESFHYSNSGYVLLGYILERVTGKAYEEVVREQILGPLGMADSGYDHPSTILANRAAGYGRRGDTWVNCIHFEMDTPHAAGALYSTVGDLQRWDQALYTEQLLPKARLEEMWTPGKGDYAYGWMVRDRQSRKCLEHGGGIAGFATYLSRIPEERILIVILSNLETANPEEMTGHLTRLLLE